MQSFDAKPINPLPSGSGRTQKTGGGTVWEGAAEEIVTLSHSSPPSLSLPFPARASRARAAAAKSEGRKGERVGKGRRNPGVQGSPESSRLAKRREPDALLVFF